MIPMSLFWVGSVQSNQLTVNCTQIVTMGFNETDNVYNNLVHITFHRMKTDVMLELAMTSSSLVLDTTLNINILQVLFVTFHYTNYHITSILTASSN